MREYLLTLAVVAASVYVVTPLVRRLAWAFKVYTPVRDRDVHTSTIPRAGGVAIFFGLFVGFGVASRLPTLRTVFEQNQMARAAIMAGAVIVVVGLIDDRWGVDPLTKFAGQVLAAGVLILNGVQLLYLPNPLNPNSPISLGSDWGVPATIILVVVAMNAVNFIDGLDGLAAGVIGISSLALCVYSWQLAVVDKIDRATPAILISSILAGACFGFLPHNFSPARIFMGDSGALLIGLLLATATIGVTGQVDPSAVGTSLTMSPTVLPLLLPVAVMAVPVLDLTLAVIRRTSHGHSPFAPDRKHLHHRLLNVGHSQRWAVLILYVWTAIVAFTVVGLAVVRNTALVWAGGVTAAVIVLVVGIIPMIMSRIQRS